MKDRSKAMGLFFCFVLSLPGGIFAQEKDVDVLKERAKTFWEARLKGDWATVYRYLPPAEKRGFTEEQFVSFRKEKGPFRYLSSELGRLEITGDLGWVEVRYAIQPAGFPEYPPRNMHLWQIWQKRDHNWFPLPRSKYTQVPKNPPHLRSAEEEALLSERVNEFWEAKEKEDWQFIYQQLDPHFRSKVSAEEFMSKEARYLYLSHRVDWAEVVEDHGRVRVTYTSRLLDPTLTKLSPVENSEVEEWIKVNGRWYRHIPEKRTE